MYITHSGSSSSFQNHLTIRLDKILYAKLYPVYRTYIRKTLLSSKISILIGGLFTMQEDELKLLSARGTKKRIIPD
jgi:hypothetical protein